jgi:hypothetical protein
MSRLLFALKPPAPEPTNVAEAEARDDHQGEVLDGLRGYASERGYRRWRRRRRASRFWTWLLLGVISEEVQKTTRGPGERRGLRRSL